MIENLRQGYWVSMTPFGYSNLNKKERAKNHRYIIHKEGELLAGAFKLKAEGRLSIKEIVLQMQQLGYKLKYKNFNALISNPFYCGLLAHKMMPGELIKGHHPPLISEELFLKANSARDNSMCMGIKKNSY
ncbi:MAG: recombinase family protein [Pelobium sp.]